MLAAAIARHLTIHDKETCGAAGAEFFDWCESAWEAAARILVRLGVAVPIPVAGSPDTLAHNFRLTASADDMPDTLARSLEGEDERIAQTVAIFIEIACTYKGLSDGRDAFEPEIFREEIRALTQLGYAESDGDRVRWTDKAAPAMRDAYLWDENLQSRAIVEARLRTAEAETAWRTMPAPIRRRFFGSRPESYAEFVGVLCRCWDSEKEVWRQPNDDRISRFAEKRFLADAIRKIAQAKPRANQRA